MADNKPLWILIFIGIALAILMTVLFILAYMGKIGSHTKPDTTSGKIEGTQGIKATPALASGDKLICYTDANQNDTEVYTAYYAISKEIDGVDYGFDLSNFMYKGSVFNAVGNYGYNFTVPQQTNSGVTFLKLWKVIMLGSTTAPTNASPWVVIARSPNAAVTGGTVELNDTTVSVSDDRQETVNDAYGNLNIPCGYTGINTNLVAVDSGGHDKW